MGTLNLTFDDGPDPRGTPQVLDALAAAEAQATFFVLGAPRGRPPGAARADHSPTGHAVGLHGPRHVRHSELDARRGPRRDTDTRARSVLGELGRSSQRAGGLPGAWKRGVDSAKVADATRPETSVQLGQPTRTTGAAILRPACSPRSPPAACATGAIVLAHDGLGPGALRDDCDETRGRSSSSLVAAGPAARPRAAGTDMTARCRIGASPQAA